MKKLFSLLALLFALNNVRAQSIIINPRVIFNPYSAQAELCNFTGFFVNCSMHLNAQTTFGTMLFGNLFNTPIYPGSCAYAYVTNYTPAPIINAWANSWCNIVHY